MISREEGAGVQDTEEQKIQPLQTFSTPGQGMEDQSS